jgi:hypothetical protein
VSFRSFLEFHFITAGKISNNKYHKGRNKDRNWLAATGVLYID